MFRQNHFFLIAILAATLSLSSCQEETAPECTISQDAWNYFLYDASAIALEHMYEEGNPDTSRVIIPSDEIAPYLQALGIIYDAKLPQRDSVVQKLLKYEYNTTQSIVVQFEANASWIALWKSGIYPTGNEYADYTITQYNLSISQEYENNEQVFLVINSNVPINGKALAQMLKPLEGVIAVYPNISFSVYSRLSCEIFENNARVTFYEGWGDCISGGCSGYHRWEFDADLNTCEVAFSGYYE